MLTLCCNVQITRRQEMVFVIDDKDILQWSGRDVYNAIEFLIEQGESRFYLAAGDGDEKLELRAKRV